MLPKEPSSAECVPPSYFLKAASFMHIFSWFLVQSSLALSSSIGPASTEMGENVPSSGAISESRGKLNGVMNPRRLRQLPLAPISHLVSESDEGRYSWE